MKPGFKPQVSTPSGYAQSLRRYLGAAGAPMAPARAQGGGNGWQQPQPKPPGQQAQNQTQAPPQAPAPNPTGGMWQDRQQSQQRGGQFYGGSGRTTWSSDRPDPTPQPAPQAPQPPAYAGMNDPVSNPADGRFQGAAGPVAAYQQGTPAAVGNRNEQAFYNQPGYGQSSQGLSVGTTASGLSGERFAPSAGGSGQGFQLPAPPPAGSQPMSESQVYQGFMQELNRQGYSIDPQGNVTVPHARTREPQIIGNINSAGYWGSLFRDYAEPRMKPATNPWDPVKEGLQDALPAFDESAIAEREAAIRQEYARQQGRALRAMVEGGARSGMDADAAYGAQGDLVSGLASQAANEVSQQRLELEKMNFQAAMTHYQTEAERLFRRASMEQDARTRAEMIKQAEIAAYRAQDIQKELMKYGADLEDRITANDIGGTLLGFGLNAGMSALGGGFR